jgi:hypothetical protein
MSNFRILINDIPKSSAMIYMDESFTEDILYPRWNILSNQKHTRIKYVTGNNFFISFDLGSGNAKSADFFCFDIAQIRKTNLTDIRLQNSTDGSSWTTVKEVLPADLVSLKGYYKTDYVSFFTESSSTRYWRVIVRNTDNQVANLGKFYFGKAINIGNPHEFFIRQSKEDNTFISDAGFSYFTKLKLDKKKFEVNFNCITEQQIINIENFLNNNIEPLVWFYCPNSSFMDNVDLLSVNILNFEITRRTNNNEVYLECEEAI